ncbi:protein kinase [Candidatus Uabimicrobium sp. HlEnr_7]|uniref:protein kinase domain-containing protein n=1 Tax=Candidatus Uabimicrobium helgolandensis TaxID=3095367 RepID=UPI00355934AE
MTDDEWLIKQVIKHRLLDSEQLKKVKHINKQTLQSYEKIITDLGLLKRTQLLMIKNSPLQHYSSTASFQQQKIVKLGRYDLEQRWPSDHFRHLFLAFDPVKDEQVMIHLWQGIYANNQSFIKKFQENAQLAKALSHPGIVKAKEFAVHQNQTFYTTDYISGLSIAETLKEKQRISPRKTIRLMRNTAEIIQHIHKEGILHGGVNPDNIVLGENDKVHLKDFVLHKSLYEMKIKLDQIPMAMVIYKSPEQIKNKQIDRSSDIYSWGATLYTMLTGQAPFSGKTFANLFEEIPRRTPITPHSINASIPIAIEKICMKCLEKEKEQRYTSFDEILKDIELFLTRNPSEKKSVPWKSVITVAVSFILSVIIFIYIYVKNIELRYEIQKPYRQQQATKEKFQNKKQQKNAQFFRSQKKTQETIAKESENWEKKISQEKIEHWKNYKSIKKTSDDSSELDTNYIKKVILKAILKISPNEKKATQELQKTIYKTLPMKIKAVYYFRNHYYAAIENGESWTKARYTCKEKMGGQLVVLETEKEFDFISLFLYELSWEACWIGLERAPFNKRRWVWINKKEMSYLRWNKSEPNNHGGNENGVEIVKFRWLNDKEKSASKHYICEWSF